MNNFNSRKKMNDPDDSLVDADSAVKEGLQSLANQRCTSACEYSRRLLIAAGLHDTSPPFVSQHSRPPIPISTLQKIAEEEMNRITKYETPTLGLIGGSQEGNSSFALARFFQRRLQDGEKGKKLQ